jgi:hypothetical protein
LEHGIPGVDHQVHQDLFHLPGVYLDQVQVWSGYSHQFDVFANKTADQFTHVNDQAVQIDYLWFDNLAAREGQELMGEVRGALRRLFYLFQVTVNRMVWGQRHDPGWRSP